MYFCGRWLFTGTTGTLCKKGHWKWHLRPKLCPLPIPIRPFLFVYSANKWRCYFGAYLFLKIISKRYHILSKRYHILAQLYFIYLYSARNHIFYWCFVRLASFACEEIETTFCFWTPFPISFQSHFRSIFLLIILWKNRRKLLGIAFRVTGCRLFSPWSYAAVNGLRH